MISLGDEENKIILTVTEIKTFTIQTDFNNAQLNELNNRLNNKNYVR